ncbi:MAG: hypothetical protein KDJ35_07775 [Alphaproteobacteria bacterium]|nr:hypothetical protein [Alphaproteobacteria bacterium]
MNNIFKQKNAVSFSYFGLLALLLLTSCTYAKEANNQSIIMNMNYHDARKIILQSGWKPADGMPPYDEIGAAAHYFRDLGYAEVSDCTGAGMLACLFYFQNEKGEYLKLGTSGEYPDPHFEIQTKIVYAAIRYEID